jgi:hypothetical protein
MWKIETFSELNHMNALVNECLERSAGAHTASDEDLLCLRVAIAVICEAIYEDDAVFFGSDSDSSRILRLVR